MTITDEQLNDLRAHIAVFETALIGAESRVTGRINDLSSQIADLSSQVNKAGDPVDFAAIQARLEELADMANRLATDVSGNGTTTDPDPVGDDPS